ncbi:PadR family transcriptional regulator [Xylophilus sp.]|uniref:PadR family transcriptional regulator n=1 Tax=Xylophilus sp. TaxID=2653893 RepID=UPI0013BB4F76|nr:PadR family transcriptional regulator [Xylophilus sp.]KAF1047283.1 MAG: Transcriptional regulator YqjI [Xylophilus sp.]
MAPRDFFDDASAAPAARRRGGGRVFGHGGLRLVLLHLLAERPRHGYELIKGIEERLGGTYSPSPGVVYPTLTLLEETGLASVEGTDGARKRYAATDTGRAFLQSHQAEVDAELARLDAHAGGHAERPPQVVRALHNLKFAVHLRLGRGPLTAAQATAFAAVLDDAARRIDAIE